MNIFDAGGLTSIIAVIVTLIIGTGIFILLHKIFDIIHLGFGAMITMWVGCCIVGAFIVCTMVFNKTSLNDRSNRLYRVLSI